MFFRRKKKAEKDIFEQGEFNIQDINIIEEREFLVSLLYANNFVDTVYPACASCYGISEDKNKEYEQKVSYIGRRVKSSHTSILEHSNIVLQVFIPLNKPDNSFSLYEKVKSHNRHIKSELTSYRNSQDIISMISEVRDVCRYLSIHTDYINKDNPIMRMTIGGSIRGFRYIFENIRNRHNSLFIGIFNVLKLVIPQEFFIDFINQEVMNEYHATIEITEDLKENIQTLSLDTKITEKLDIINMDDLNHISELLKLDKEDCFDFVSITTNFKNMSRIITQQLTRHRNGITQESQRYVDYSNSKFNSPADFKDKYDPNEKYDTPFGKYTLQELGDFIGGVYEYLIAQGVDKEDARGYLPQNNQSGKVFMTFNLRTLFIFLHLRLDKHAQAEIREYANILASLTKKYSKELSMKDMHQVANIYSQPIYKKEQLKYDILEYADNPVI